MTKPILCIDFDGVIHRYSSGWLDGSIYDIVTEGFFDWASKAKDHFRLVIYSSRSSDPEKAAEMYWWLLDQFTDWRQLGGYYSDLDFCHFEFANEKPPAFLTIDDRAVTFTGDWDEFDPQRLLEFKTWTSRILTTDIT